LGTGGFTGKLRVGKVLNSSSRAGKLSIDATFPARAALEALARTNSSVLLAALFRGCGFGGGCGHGGFGHVEARSVPPLLLVPDAARVNFQQPRAC
jgi:hypothetical protein